MIYPPSTTHEAPCTKLAFSLLKKITTSATSSGSPMRFMGAISIGSVIRGASDASGATEGGSLAVMGVLMMPGHTALTRIPKGDASMASQRVKPSTADLLAQYRAACEPCDHYESLSNELIVRRTSVAPPDDSQLTGDIDDTPPLPPDTLQPLRPRSSRPQMILLLHNRQLFLFAHPQPPIVDPSDLVKVLHRALVRRQVVAHDPGAVDRIV